MSLPEPELVALARAVAVASPLVGATSPNPAVGCVLIDAQGRLLGEGATAPAGGPHAEVLALAAAGSSAAGATAAVTLEPCDHQGRTPPCTRALLDAGIAKVVVAHPDPNPVSGDGLRRLREAGVAVVGPLPAGDPLREAVAAQLEGFLSVVERGRPHVTLKLAQTTDGELRAVPPQRWLTGPAARRAVHRLRTSCDAVLVGSGTVLADDPRLDVRDVEVVRQPRAVVLDARLRTPADAAVARPGTIVVTTPQAAADSRRRLVERGVEVVDVPPAAGGGVALPAALRTLASLGVAAVLAEPGATLARALVLADLVDRLVLHIAAGVGDGPAARAVPSPPAGPWRTVRAGGAGADAILHLVPSARLPAGRSALDGTEAA